MVRGTAGSCQRPLRIRCIVKKKSAHDYRQRPDGRALERSASAGSKKLLAPRTGIPRGQTQVCTVCTLGLKSDEQIRYTERKDRSATYTATLPAYRWRNETSPFTGRVNSTGLAERALLPVIPSEEEFLHTALAQRSWSQTAFLPSQRLWFNTGR